MTTTTLPLIAADGTACGCRAHAVADQHGVLHWVPAEGCGAHCGCSGCARARQLLADYATQQARVGLGRVAS